MEYPGLTQISPVVATMSFREKDGRILVWDRTLHLIIGSFQAPLIWNNFSGFPEVSIFKEYKPVTL